MLQHIRRLELAGDRAELLSLAASCPQGDALARVYIALSKIQENAASTGAEYRQALAYAQQAVSAADQGGLMWTWAQGRIAALSADLGFYQTAERAASAFLCALPGHSEAQTLAPWVHFAMARVHAARRDYPAALESWTLTEGTASGELAERARLHHAWTLAQAGRVNDALDILPQSVAHVSTGHLSAATAVIHAAAGTWSGARAHALIALRTHAAGEWLLCDTVQAAELLLILKRAATHAGDFGQAAGWHQHIAATLCGWNADLMTHLLPILPTKGGAWIDEAASSCGPTGYRRTGLLGTIG